MAIHDSTYSPSPGPYDRRLAVRSRLGTLAGDLRLVPPAAARGVALFFGLFALLNLVGEARTPGFDQNVWWLDLRPLPADLSAVLLGMAGGLLVWWALRPATTIWRRLLTVTVLVALAALAVKNGVTFYHVWQEGLIRPWMPVPFSFVLAVVLALLGWAAAASASAHRGPSRYVPALVLAAALLLCGVLFPLAQQAFFGKTTYMRRAQVAVVIGAEVHRDGRASITHADRVRTAAMLYRDGYAERLLMSGGQGADEPVNETSVMRSLAVGYGVPAARIALDSAGVNTDATVRDTLPVLRERGYRSVAVVSDFFHLPRIKLAYQSAGYDVITVPSRARKIPQTTGLVVREIPAFWVYYLRAVL